MKVQYGGGCQKGVKWDRREYNVPERSSVVSADSQTHTHTHMHAYAQEDTNVETRLLPKQAVWKNVIHMRKQEGGTGLCNTAKRHRSHLIIHMTVGVADDHQHSLWLAKKKPATRVKMDLTFIWKIPWCQCTNFLKPFYSIQECSWGQGLQVCCLL